MGTLETVIVSGGTGFLGSVIVKKLLLAGYHVTVIKRSTSSLARLFDVLKNKNLALFEWRPTENSALFNTKYCKAIIHTATCYGRNDETISEIGYSNLLFPLELLEASHRYRVPVFINTDTFSQSEIEMQGREKYYVSFKKDFIRYAKAASKTLPGRFCNLTIEQMYGPDDNTTKFVPWIINELFANRSTIDMTGGKQKRDFIFVEDCADAYLQILKNTSKLDNYNEFGIGTGSSIELKKMVLFLKQYIASTSALNFGSLPYRKNEIMDHVAITKNNHKIEWIPKFSWEEGLKKTADFYRP